METPTDEAGYQKPHCLNTQTTLLQGNTVQKSLELASYTSTGKLLPTQKDRKTKTIHKSKWRRDLLYCYCAVLELWLLRAYRQSSRRGFLNCCSKNLLKQMLIKNRMSAFLMYRMSAFLPILWSSKLKLQMNSNQETMVSSTHAGEALNALGQPHGSTWEELLEPTTLMQVPLLTTSACHTTRNITTPLKKQFMQHLSMGQSMKHGAAQ